MNNKRKRKTLSINELTSEVYNTTPIKKGLNEAEIFDTWNRICDEKILIRTEKLFVKDDKIYIKLMSSPLRNELDNNKKIILEKFKKEHHQINEIYFIWLFNINSFWNIIRIDTPINI